MGSLSNLYISQSYQSLIHFSTDTSASATLTQLEDGLGNDLGIYFNTDGDVRMSGDVQVDGFETINKGLTVSGAVLINTQYSASTQAYTNQNTNIGNTITVQGTYPSNEVLPTVNDIQVGWKVNGPFVTNATVLSITGKNTGNVNIVIDQSSARPAEDYIFTGNFVTIVAVTGSTSITNDLFVGGHLIIEDGVEITGSIDITGNVTASAAFIENDLIVSGTLFAKEVHTLIESSSIIFSSGSNILGDSVLDTQTLNGTVIMSGSGQLTGSMGITGDLNVLGNISSSTISGIGNVTTYSQSVDNRLDIVEATASLYVPFSTSVDSRLDYLEGPFSTSVDFRLDQLELFTASVGLVTTQSFQQYTASTNADLFSVHQTTSSLNAYTASQDIKNLTLASYTASNDTKWTTLSNVTSSILSFTSSINNKFSTLEVLTGSFATTGSNTFTGTNTFNKSVNGGVNALSITSNTASMDCSLGNFFTLTLASSTSTRLIPTNVQAGQTISLKILQPATTGSLTYNSSTIKFPSALQYTASAVSNASDILTFVTYDASTLFAVAVKNMI